jgi:hypothetical protein
MKSIKARIACQQAKITPENNVRMMDNSVIC